MAFTKRYKTMDYHDLQIELEERYGEAMAQEIVEEIRKADDLNFEPDYMHVKAASEVTELFRNEVRSTILMLKLRKKVHAANDTIIAELEVKRLQADLEKLLGFYQLSQKTFYRLYKKAMESYKEQTPEKMNFDYFPYEYEMATAG